MLATDVFSIKGYFDRRTVLLTGASGYIGSLVLEKLLRTTDVKCVYILLRAKHGKDTGSRLRRLLQSSLFHIIRDRSVIDKVIVVAGDVLAQDLGLSLADRAKLETGVNTVIHCAADIRLEASMRDTLLANYEGTRKLLELARGFQGLDSFIHVSTAFTNMNQPTGAVIEERLYTLKYGDNPVDPEELVKELLGVPSWEADIRAQALLAAFSFPNTYTLGKHLTEHLVQDYQQRYGLPIAIVRPALVSAVARDPYPGYTGNYAGHVGAILAFIVGFFNCPGACGWRGGNVWDVIPSDVVANIIVATAAVVGSGLAGQCALPATRSGRLSSPSFSSSTASSNVVEAAVTIVPQATRAIVNAAVGKSAAAAGGADDGAGKAHAAAAAPGLLSPFSPHPWCDARPLTDQMVGEEVSSEEGTSEDPSCGVSTPVSLGSGAVAADRAAPLLVIHAGSSTTYPLTIMESWNLGLVAVASTSVCCRLCFGLPEPLTSSHEPSESALSWCNKITGWKVRLITTLLRWAGQHKVARQVQMGFAAFLVINKPQVDRNHKFSSTTLRRLAAALNPAEAQEYMLVWQPSGSSQDINTKALEALGEGLEDKESHIRSVPCDWTTYHMNLGAYLYKHLFGKTVPFERPMESKVVKAALGLKPGAPIVLKHSFRHYG